MPTSSIFSLLRQRRFAPFFWTQFLGALNDNVFKIGFTSLVTYQTALFGTLDGQQAAFVISALFIAPFLLFSASSGQLADKLDKALVMRMVKWLEIAIMLMGAVGFVMHSLMLLYAGVFLMGLHSTLFGPVKYAFLPQHLTQGELVAGNGLVEGGTFLAILIGTIAGGELANLDLGRGSVGPLALAVVCVVIAVLGRFAVAGVPSSPASEPGLSINWNPFSETWRNLSLARQIRVVFLSLLGISWLWFVGATFLTSFFSYAKNVLGAGPSVVTLLLAMFSIGIACGSLLCERLSRGRVEIGLVPFGSIGMTLFGVDLYFSSQLPTHGLIGLEAFLLIPAHWRILVDLFLMAMFTGFYSVPLYALIQIRCPPSHRARIIAANNILNALFMIVSALLAMAMLGHGYTIPELFLTVACLNALVAIYIYSLVPEFLFRFVFWVLIHTVYRIRSENLQRIPDDGAAVLVCNHVSFIDAVIVGALSPRPIRFVMDHRIFRLPLANWFFRQMRTIPIAPAHEDAELLRKAYEACAQALAEGELLCIFPEGKITSHGEINPFKSGVEQIISRTPTPVVPMALRGLWGSFFSRKDGQVMTRPLRRGILNKLELIVGEPMAPEAATAERLQQVVLSLRGPWQ